MTEANARRSKLLCVVMVLAVGSPASGTRAKEPIAEDARTGTSSASASGAENGCVHCHENAPGELSRAVSDWRRSVHAEEGVTCDSCHGGDPQVLGEPDDASAAEAAHFSPQGFVHRPAAAKVAYFCGTCHAAIKEKHLGSPHGENVHPTCTFCHGHHEVRAPTTTIIEPDRCTLCHDFRNAELVRQTIERTEANIRELEEKARWLEEHGYRALALEEMHEHSRATVTQLRIAFHSFHLGEVSNFASQLQAVLDQTQHTVEIVERKDEARTLQTWIGLGAAGLLVAFATLLMAYKRRYLDHATNRSRLAALAACSLLPFLSCSTRGEPGEEPQAADPLAAAAGNPPDARPGGDAGDLAARHAGEPKPALSPSGPPAAEAPAGPAPRAGAARAGALPPASSPPSGPAPSGAPEASRAAPSAAHPPPPRAEAPASARAVGDDMTLRDYSQDCLRSGCHRDVANRPRVHGPLLVGACGECHKERAGAEHAFESTRPAETLCTSCHREAARRVRHKPFAESRCLECHDPHAGPTAMLLREEGTGALCAKCHELPKTEKVHGPVALGECSACHSAHQSDDDGLLAYSKRELCVRCHSEVSELLDRLPHVHGPAAVDCSACHLPHGGSDASFLRGEPRALCLGCHDSVAVRIAADLHVHGALENEKGCTSCHTPHASLVPSQLRAVAAELCLSCHDRELAGPGGGRVANMKAELAAATHKHGPVRTGECEGCHSPHSSQHQDLLVESYPPEFYKEFELSSYSLCFRCHEESLVLVERTRTLTRFRDGDRNLHYLHVHQEKGRTCRACHAVHASNLPAHIRESIPFGSAGWKLPIQYQATTTGGKCSPGCHKPATYDNGGAPAGAGAGAGARSG